MIKKKVYQNGLTLLYRHKPFKCTSVCTSFVYDKEKHNFSNAVPHFCEHMFNYGTKTKTKEEVTEKIQQTFTGYNATTSSNYIFSYYYRSNKMMDECFKLQAEMLLDTNFQEKNIKTESEVIKQEQIRYLERQDTIFALSRLKVLYEHYKDKTYLIGTEKEIEKVNKKELTNFYDKTFISENCYVTVCGGISYRKAKSLTKKYFVDNIPSSPENKITGNLYEIIDRQGNLNLENTKSNLKMSHCDIIFRVPKQFESIETNVIIRIIDFLMCGLNGKLFTALRNKGLVYAVNHLYSVCPSSYYLDFCFQCSKENINTSINEISKILKDLKENPLLNEYLTQIKNKIKMQEDEKAFKPKDKAEIVFRKYTMYGTQIFTEKYKKTVMKALLKITPQQIQDFCKEVFSNPENIYVSIVANYEKRNEFYSYKQIQKILTTGEINHRKNNDKKENI